jgi:hypothetical protein
VTDHLIKSFEWYDSISQLLGDSIGRLEQTDDWEAAFAALPQLETLTQMNAPMILLRAARSCERYAAEVRRVRHGMIRAIERNKTNG